MAMLMAAMRPQMLAGVVLNDIGPELDPSARARIQSYAGRLPPVRTWDDAAADEDDVRSRDPDYSEEQWLAFARLSFDEGDDGVPRLAADPKIGDADPQHSGAAGATQAMWSRIRAAARHSGARAARRAIPICYRRRRSSACNAKCRDSSAVTVPNRGHAPQLDEPDSLRAIDAFLRAAR